MGYQNRAADKTGWNLIAGTFLPVGKTGDQMTLNDVAANDVWDPTSDNIQFLTSSGATRVRKDGKSATYTYINADWATELSCEIGWYQDVALGDGEFLPPEEEDDFSYGVGAVVQAANTSSALLFSGEVAKGKQTILAKHSGWNLIGNPLPVDRTMADISANEVWDPTSDNIQFLTSSGATRIRQDGKLATYTYINSDWATELACEPGWYQDVALGDGEFLPPESEDNIVKAGSAFVVQSVSNEAGIQFKAALPAED